MHLNTHRMLHALVAWAVSHLLPCQQDVFVHVALVSTSDQPHPMGLSCCLQVENVVVLRQEAFDDQKAWVDDETHNIIGNVTSLADALKERPTLPVPVTNLRFSGTGVDGPRAAGDYSQPSHVTHTNSCSTTVQTCLWPCAGILAFQHLNQPMNHSAPSGEFCWHACRSWCRRLGVKCCVCWWLGWV